MSKITLEPNASGAGTFSIVSPDSNTNRTLNLPDASGNIIAADASTGQFDSSNMPAGSVIQVVQGSTDTQVTSTSDSYVDIGLSASISPVSTTSKILVTASVQGRIQDDTSISVYIAFQISKNGDPIFTPSVTFENGILAEPAGGRVRLRNRWPLMYLDSPNSSGSLTYSIEAAANAGEIRLQEAGNTSFITLMEIAG